MSRGVLVVGDKGGIVRLFYCKVSKLAAYRLDSAVLPRT